MASLSFRFLCGFSTVDAELLALWLGRLLRSRRLDVLQLRCFWLDGFSRSVVALSFSLSGLGGFSALAFWTLCSLAVSGWTASPVQWWL